MKITTASLSQLETHAMSNLALPNLTNAKKAALRSLIRASARVRSELVMDEVETTLHTEAAQLPLTAGGQPIGG
jgi:hypothetical protein